MKRIIILLGLFILMGCAKHQSFEVPDGDITIMKNQHASECFEGNAYEPLVIKDEKDKQVLIENINSWKLIDRTYRESPDSCGARYQITWEDHKIEVGLKNNAIRIDHKTYELKKGNMDFLDDYQYKPIFETDKVTIMKNWSASEGCFEQNYESLIITEDDKIQEIMDTIKYWYLRDRNNQEYPPSCGALYVVTWNHHRMDIVEKLDNSLLILFDGITYEVYGETTDFLDVLSYVPTG